MTKQKTELCHQKVVGKYTIQSLEVRGKTIRFRTLNPAENLGFKFYCYCKKESIINATQHKALATLVGGWNLMRNGREVGALGPGKTGRISGGGLG